MASINIIDWLLGLRRSDGMVWVTDVKLTLWMMEVVNGSDTDWEVHQANLRKTFAYMPLHRQPAARTRIGCLETALKAG